KKLGEAIDRALVEIEPKLREEFAEFTEFEVLRAISKRALQPEEAASKEFWAKVNAEAKERNKRYEAERAANPQPQPVDDAATRERQRQQHQEYRERMRQEQEQRMQERKADEEMGLAIVRAGYRALAAKHHPDTGGGTAEAMRRLNKARDRLRTNV